MTAPRTGSRYELQVDRAGAQESKVERDYYAIHTADIEDIAEEDDLVGYVHSYEVGSTVDGPGLRFVAFLTGCLLRCQYLSLIHISEPTRLLSISYAVFGLKKKTERACYE